MILVSLVLMMDDQGHLHRTGGGSARTGSWTKLLRPSIHTSPTIAMHCCSTIIIFILRFSLMVTMMMPFSSFSPTGSSLPSLHLTSSSQSRAGGTSILVVY